MTFRETGNVRLVLEAWQTKTLKRSSLVRDLYTIRLTITPPPAPRLRVTSSVESKITPLCHQVTLGKGIPIHRKNTIIRGGSQITFASLGGWVVQNLEKLLTFSIKSQV